MSRLDSFVAAKPLVFLGNDPRSGATKIIEPEKNLLTFAGAGSGKGACHIIPNLRDWWAFNALVIDPSGEAAEATAQHRKDKYGGTVAVIDPYRYANVPESFRAAFNPLDMVRSASDLSDIAEGLIARSANESQPHFNDSAEDVVAGLMAFILEAPALTDKQRSLARLPDLIAALQDPQARGSVLAAMKSCERFDGLARQIAQRLTPDNTEVSNILGTLRTQTRWLDAETMAALSTTGFLHQPDDLDPRDVVADAQTFDLGQLKEGMMTLYLVIPADKLGSKGRFLRLFTRVVLSIMLRKTADGRHMGSRCLFLLDEAYALGRINEVISASGQMRKYGLHLWPFFQSIGQITELYGDNGFETMTEDADALTVFGVRGQDICEYASRRIGVFKDSDIDVETLEIEKAQREGYLRALYPELFDWFGGEEEERKISQLIHEFLRGRVGRPYRQPDEIRDLVRKHEGEPIPRALLYFDGGGYRVLMPEAWFAPLPDTTRHAMAERPKLPFWSWSNPNVQWQFFPFMAAFIFWGILSSIFLSPILPDSPDGGNYFGLLLLSMGCAWFLERRTRGWFISRFR